MCDCLVDCVYFLFACICVCVCVRKCMYMCVCVCVRVTTDVFCDLEFRTQEVPGRSSTRQGLQSPQTLNGRKSMTFCRPPPTQMLCEGLREGDEAMCHHWKYCLAC